MTNLTPGGKSLSGDGTHSPVITVRVPATVRDTLQWHADQRGVGLSKIVRQAIDEYLKRH